MHNEKREDHGMLSYSSLNTPIAAGAPSQNSGSDGKGVVRRASWTILSHWESQMF